MRTLRSRLGHVAVVLLVLSGCGSSDKAQVSGTGQVRMNVVLPNGATISTVNWTLDCGPTSPVPNPGPYHQTGSWDVSHSNTISGVIGGIPLADTFCTLSLSARDSLAPTTAPNCTGVVANVSPGSLSAVGLSCTDQKTIQAGSGTQSISTQSAVTTTQGVHTCAGLTFYSASPAEVNVDSSIALSATATAPADGATVTIQWSSSDGQLTPAANTGTSATYKCGAVGLVNITVTANDNFVGVNGTTCSPQSSATFTVNCTQGSLVGPGTGGASSTGGAAPTGGAGEPCQCNGTGPSGPVTVACGQSACGSDYIIYSCSDSVFTLTGQSCAPPCQCSGTGPSGPVTVACGQSACGSDYIIYSCSDSVFTLTGQSCADSGAPCQCNGTGPSGPVTVACGQSACGSDYIIYSCSDSVFTLTGQSCAPPCQCSGTGPSGPVTVACGQSACGSDYIIYSCSDSVFTLTGQSCADSGAPCQCTGTGPSGPVTVACGQSACGSDYITYSCSASGWTSTGQACSP